VMRRSYPKAALIVAPVVREPPGCNHDRPVDVGPLIPTFAR
jgi:hypothetical protein